MQLSTVTMGGPSRNRAMVILASKGPPVQCTRGWRWGTGKDRFTYLNASNRVSSPAFPGFSRTQWH